jgi:hypothetical protein
MASGANKINRILEALSVIQMDILTINESVAQLQSKKKVPNKDRIE